MQGVCTPEMTCSFINIHVACIWQKTMPFIGVLQYRPSDRVRKKRENYTEIFGKIMQTKVIIMRKFQNLIKPLPWLFSMYKIHVKVLPRILVLYDMFDVLVPFMGRYFFIQCSFSIDSPKLSNQALTRKTGHRKSQTRTQAHQKKMHGTPGSLKLFTNLLLFG